MQPETLSVRPVESRLDCSVHIHRKDTLVYTYTLVHCTPSRTGKGLGTFTITKVKAYSHHEAVAPFVLRRMTLDEIAAMKK